MILNQSRQWIHPDVFQQNSLLLYACLFLLAFEEALETTAPLQARNENDYLEKRKPAKVSSRMLNGNLSNLQM